MDKDTKALLYADSIIQSRSKDIKEASWGKQAMYVLETTTPEQWAEAEKRLMS